MQLIVPFGIANQILTFIINYIQISTQSEQPFDNWASVLSYCIVQWRLAVLVHVVVLTAVIFHELADFHMAPGNAVEDWVLAVGVNIIDTKSLINQKLAHFRLSISRCVVQWCLLQIIFRPRVHALLDQLCENKDG